MAKLSCLTHLQIHAQELPSTVMIDLARLPSLTSLTLRCRAQAWVRTHLRSSLHLFKQLKELRVSGHKLNRNTHVYLWQHKAEYTSLEWEQLMLKEPSAADVQARYQSTVQEFRTTERIFVACAYLRCLYMLSDVFWFLHKCSVSSLYSAFVLFLCCVLCPPV